VEGAFLYAAILILVYLVSKINKSIFSRLEELCFILVLFILSIEVFYGWLYSSEKILISPHLLRLNTPFVFLIGPAIYYYVLLVNSGEEHFRRRDIMHLMPFAICLIYLLPLYFSSGQEKLTYIQTNMMNELGPDSYRIGGLRRIQHFVYIVLIIRIYWKKSENIISWRKPELLAIIFILIWSLDMYRYFFDFSLYSGLINTAVLSVFTLILVFSDLVQNSSKKRSKYLSSGISKTARARLTGRIHFALEQEKLYQNQDFTLSSFAKLLDIQPTYLSQVINQDLGTSFRNLINRYRIENAKTLLRDPDCNNLTIEAIAMQVGFGSVSTFNEAFKKIEGITPSKYKNK
jgi:AraC-like DNA-binding protein